MSYKPAGYPDVSAYIVVPDPQQVLDFAAAVFEAETLRVFREGDRIAHAETRIGDSVVMMGAAEGAPTMLHVYLPDPDAALARALEHVAELLAPMEDHDDGDRRGGVRAPDGTMWYVSRQH